VSLAIAFIVAVFLKDTPLEAGFDCDFTVKASSNKKKDDGDNDDSTQMTWKDLLTSPFLWLVAVAYFIVFAAKTSVTEWGQMFLIEDLGHSPFVGINLNLIVIVFKVFLMAFSIIFRDDCICIITVLRIITFQEFEFDTIFLESK